MPSEKRKARKKNYFKAAKKSKKYAEGKVLKEGMVGFLLTCNNREKEAVREGYNLLNEFADKLFGSEKKPDEIPHKKMFSNSYKYCDMISEK